jgi:hypothetical protein
MEKEIISLIARDRLEIPLSSMYQKIRKIKSSSAKNIAEILRKTRFSGERTYAFTEDEDKERARGMKEAVSEFCQEFPKYGKILEGKISEKRTIAEKHLYFGVNLGCRLTTEDYVGVMQSLGLSEQTARNLYPELLTVSRKLAKEREEERSIIIGKYEQD